MTIKKQQMTLSTADIFKAPIQVHTAREFDEMIILTLETEDAFIDVLLNKGGELVEPGQQDKEVKNLASFFNKSFFNKSFEEILFDNSPGLAHIFRL